MTVELDAERLLAAAARRLAQLGHDAAAVALTDSDIVAIRFFNDGRYVEIDLVVGGENYDALKDPDVWAQHHEVDYDGEETWTTPVIQQVFVSVLPPATDEVRLRAAIRNEPVTGDWRELDGQGRMRPAPKTALAHLDVSAIPTNTDLLLHLNRLNRLDQQPEEMIGAAKDLIEATSKAVLLGLGKTFDTDDDVAAVSKRALAELRLHPEAIAPTTKGADTMKRILGGLQQIAIGMAELRNMGYGTGHGHGRRVAGLSERHAELAARASTAYVAFILATLNEPNAPWRRQQTEPESAPQSALVVGHRVSHATFGPGTVVSVKATTSDVEVRVLFDDTAKGTKRLLASIAKLELLDS
jgi:hypothetical protein